MIIDIYLCYVREVWKYCYTSQQPRGTPIFCYLTRSIAHDDQRRMSNNSDGSQHRRTHMAAYNYPYSIRWNGSPKNRDRAVRDVIEYIIGFYAMETCWPCVNYLLDQFPLYVEVGAFITMENEGIGFYSLDVLGIQSGWTVNLSFVHWTKW